MNEELSAEEQALAERLDTRKPAPAAGFRGALGRHLSAQDPGYGPRPRHLQLLVSAYLLAATVLITIGALDASAVL